MKKKKRIQFALSQEADEMIDDIALLYSVSRSIIVERCIRYIYENNLEGEIFSAKHKKHKKEREVSKEEIKQKEKESSGVRKEERESDFIIKL